MSLVGFRLCRESWSLGSGARGHLGGNRWAARRLMDKFSHCSVQGSKVDFVSSVTVAQYFLLATSYMRFDGTSLHSLHVWGLPRPRIQPGCEVVELGGNMVGAMTGEQFEAAMSQRPLRIRVLPPNAAVWQQVAHFQKQVVRLSFQKVLLQKALRDEHDNLKKELGIDSDVEAKQKARASLARADIAGQRTQLERRKQEVAKQEAELETKREQAAAFDQETQTRRKALKADMAHLASQQAELEKARHDFDTMRKTKLHPPWESFLIFVYLKPKRKFKMSFLLRF